MTNEFIIERAKTMVYTIALSLIAYLILGVLSSLK
jgi:hypothetical protein